MNVIWNLEIIIQVIFKLTGVQVLKKCVENCQNAAPILLILLSRVREEAVLFNNNKFIDFIDNKIKTLEN